MAIPGLLKRRWRAVALAAWGLGFALLLAGAASLSAQDVVTLPDSKPATAAPSPTAAVPAPTGSPVAAESPTAVATGEPTTEAAPPKPTPSPTPVFPLAVMVDNFTAARPQRGLEAADVVYEALAEGGITRFLAIFASHDPGLVGPVRSARHYYVYWAAEYNAPLLHIMASDEGYGAIQNAGVRDLDEHRGDPGFIRSNDRRPPFNAYANPAQARQILTDEGQEWPGSMAGFWKLPAPRVLNGNSARQIDIVYPQGGHQVNWTYDRSRRLYARSQDGAPHVDAYTGGQLTAHTVIIQFVPAWQVDFTEGYLDMTVTGVGKAIYFQEGLATEGAWIRPSLGNPTQWLGPTAQPIALRPGPIWVQVVPVGPLEGAVSVRGRDASVRAVDLQRNNFPTTCTQCRGRAGYRW